MAALLTILALYVVLAAVLTLAQGRILYPAPTGPGAEPSGFERITYETSDGLTLTAGYRPARGGQPTIVYFHGNGADWQSSVVATDRLVPEGYGVLAAEYRGYRGNPGSPSEEGLYRDGRAALAWLAERGVSPQRTVLIGNSIGSGVATRMAREVQPAALILISPFSSLTELAAEKVRWLPTRLLLRDRYDNVAALPEVRSPVLILHGDADDLIPPAHARKLAAARPGTELVIVPSAGHDLAWLPEAEWHALAFLERVLGEGP
ncbi:alpha/beta hydrolase [Pelagerythrobacter sp.]|uniref:alpha/beta hydrolase n=1 Tax=Pelagerythrobacter sp. TaxID=2800702 RepID=UPI0035B1F2F5